MATARVPSDDGKTGRVPSEEDVQGSSKAPMSNCCKGAIACGVCSAVIAAIMIPVGMLVIAPNMGQHALNVAVMNIPNSTVYNLPDDFGVSRMATIFNNVSLSQTSLPFYAKLHATDLVMHIPPASTGPDLVAQSFDWGEVDLGWMTMPEQGVRHGVNAFNFDVPFTVMDPDTLVKWTLALGIGAYVNGTDVYVVGEPKLTALGMITMKLKLGKRLNCQYVPAPPPPPAPTPPPPPPAPPAPAPAPGNGTAPAPAGPAPAAPSPAAPAPVPAPADMDSITARRLARGIGPVTLTCTDQGELDSDFIDAILQNFTFDRAHHTITTTAAAAPAPAELV